SYTASWCPAGCPQRRDNRRLRLLTNRKRRQGDNAVASGRSASDGESRPALQLVEAGLQEIVARRYVQRQLARVGDQFARLPDARRIEAAKGLGVKGSH